MSKSGGEKLRKVERGGEGCSSGGCSVNVSECVCVCFTICCCVIKKWPNESRAGFILHGRLAHPWSQPNRRQGPAGMDPKLTELFVIKYIFQDTVWLCARRGDSQNVNLDVTCNLTMMTRDFGFTSTGPDLEWVNKHTDSRWYSRLSYHIRYYYYGGEGHIIFSLGLKT